MTRHRLLVMTCIVVFLLPSLASPVAAEDGPPLDDAWREERRSLDVARIEDGFRASSIRDSDLGEDELQVRFYLGDGHLRVRYVSTESGNESLLILDLHVLSLVEFRDVDGDGGYGFADEVVHRIPLAQMEPGRVAVEPFLSGGRLATVTYDLPDEREDDGGLVGGTTPALFPGQVVLRFYMLPSTQIFDGSRVTPMEVKFDIEIDRYPFRASDTMIALETRFAANRPMMDATWSDRAIEVPDGFFRGYLGWEGEVMVDGRTEQVSVTTVSQVAGSEAEQSRFVAFAYPAGDRIVHDPEIGILRYEGVFAEVLDRLVQGDWLLYGLGLAVTALAVGIPAGIRLRER